MRHGNSLELFGQLIYVDVSMRARVRAGDADAFGELFDEYARSVYNLAFRLTGSWSVAEDVVSLTFLDAWRLRGRVDPEGGSLRPWLLGIATNVARNTRRAARRHETALARLPPPEAVPDFAEEIASHIDNGEQVAAVREALAALRQPEREVLALCVWSELPYAEAAQALGVPVGTVRSRLSRARKKLNKLVTENKRRAADENREPQARRRQVEGDRENAARSVQERTQ